MNVEYFIAKRLVSAKEGNNRLSRPIIRIAILAIALSVAVMLISIGVVKGFKKDIADKVIGFGSHIQITNLLYHCFYLMHDHQWQLQLTKNQLKEQLI